MEVVAPSNSSYLGLIVAGGSLCSCAWGRNRSGAQCCLSVQEYKWVLANCPNLTDKIVEGDREEFGGP